MVRIAALASWTYIRRGKAFLANAVINFLVTKMYVFVTKKVKTELEKKGFPQNILWCLFFETWQLSSGVDYPRCKPHYRFQKKMRLSVPCLE